MQPNCSSVSYLDEGNTVQSMWLFDFVLASYERSFYESREIKHRNRPITASMTCHFCHASVRMTVCIIHLWLTWRTFYWRGLVELIRDPHLSWIKLTQQRSSKAYITQPYKHHLPWLIVILEIDLICFNLILSF